MLVKPIVTKKVAPAWGFQTGTASLRDRSAATQQGTGVRSRSAQRRLRCTISHALVHRRRVFNAGEADRIRQERRVRRFVALQRVRSALRLVREQM
jgi:hypothetical protein